MGFMFCDFRISLRQGVKIRRILSCFLCRSLYLFFLSHAGVKKPGCFICVNFDLPVCVPCLYLKLFLKFVIVIISDKITCF